MRLLLAIPIILIVLWVLYIKFDQREAAVVSTKVQPVDTLAADSLKQAVGATLDSFNQLKPALKQAVKKIKYQDSLLKCYRHQAQDTFIIKRLKYDLYEAQLEFRRLTAPR